MSAAAEHEKAGAKSANGAQFKQDISVTEHFLMLLDEGADAFTFQTFDDNSDRNNPALISAPSGTLEDLWPMLCGLNNQGAGVFITVNETDLMGRTRDNVTRIRAVWQEADRGDTPELPCEPHMVIESSPGKYHRYVLTDTTSLDEFEAVQMRVVEDYGSDPNAKDRSRVLRLPGFYHQKVSSRKNLTGEPHLVKIIHESGQQPLPWEEVKKLFPPVVNGHKTYDAPESSPKPLPTDKVDEVESALNAIEPDGDYNRWLHIGMALHSTGAGQQAFDLWDEWSANGASYREGECTYKWASFGKKEEYKRGPKTLNTLFQFAKEAGWKWLGHDAPPGVAPESAPVYKSHTNLPPDGLFELDGVLREVQGYFLATARYPQPVFALGASLTAIGAIMGNRYRLENLYPNLYTVAIGPTGCGKESPRVGIKQIMKEAGLLEHLGEGVGSGPGIEDRLLCLAAGNEDPCITYLLDEFGRMMQGLKADEGHDHGIMAILLKLYTAVDSVYVPRDLSARAKTSANLPKFVMHPFVSIYGSSTQESVHTALSAADAEVGWLGRFLLLPTHTNRPRRQQAEIAGIVPEAIREWITDCQAAIKVTRTGANLAKFTGTDQVVVHMDNEAQALEARLCEKIDADLASDDIHPIVRAASVRSLEMTKKLAMIRAAGRDPYQPLIKTLDLEWAQQLVDWSISHVGGDLIASIESAGAGEHGKQVDRCLGFIRSAKTYNDREFLKVTKLGFMPRRLLQKKMKLEALRFNVIVAGLIASGEICEVILTKEAHGMDCDSAFHLPGGE